jgi:hypothetical protein
VDELATIAAYTIHSAHELSPSTVGGLDIGIYRDREGRFEKADSATADAYWDKARAIDIGLRELLATKGLPRC